MSADSSAATDAIKPVATATGTPGELLRGQRELRQLSVQQAAEDLHLDVKLVEAIEANNFQALGPPVYAKGHLRKYAALLGLAPESVIELYYKLPDVPPAPAPIPVTTPMSRPRYRGSRAPKSRRRLFILLALLVAAGIGLVVKSRLSAAHIQMPAAIPAMLEPSNTGPDAIPPQNLSTTAPEADVPAAAAAADVDNAVATQTAPAATENTAGNNRVTLQLEFTAASWSEIYDATGKRLMFGVGQPGQVRTVAGVAPLKVILGVAAAAKIAVNERSVAVPRQPGKDATRFMVAADGSVR